jgi:hypothetical protein
MAPVLKTGIPERVSGVRIPHSPPRSLRCRETSSQFLGNRWNWRVIGEWFAQSGPEKVSFATRRAGLGAFFSEGKHGSPVSRVPSGECIAITKR